MCEKTIKKISPGDGALSKMLTFCWILEFSASWVHQDSPEGLVPTQPVGPGVSDSAGLGQVPECAFLPSFQMLLLVVQGPHLRIAAFVFEYWCRMEYWSYNFLYIFIKIIPGPGPGLVCSSSL